MKQKRMFGLFCLIIAFASLTYATYLHFSTKRRRCTLREEEEEKYRENMRTLGIEGEDVDKLIRRFPTIYDLIEANKKLEKAVSRHKLS